MQGTPSGFQTLSFKVSRLTLPLQLGQGCTKAFRWCVSFGVHHEVHFVGVICVGWYPDLRPTAGDHLGGPPCLCHASGQVRTGQGGAQSRMEYV